MEREIAGRVVGLKMELEAWGATGSRGQQALGGNRLWGATGLEVEVWGATGSMAGLKMEDWEVASWVVGLEVEV
jgi:hypothetical protein